MRELTLPVHPELEHIFGYSGNMQAVIFYLEPHADKLCWEDGERSGSANTWAWLLWRAHHTVKPNYNGGTLLLDRVNRKLYLPTLAEALQALSDPLPLDEQLQQESTQGAWDKAQQLMAEFVVWLGNQNSTPKNDIPISACADK